MRGMAAYAIDLDSLGADTNSMGGIDTKTNIPFNVLVTTDTTDTGPWSNNPADQAAGNYDL
ncbi:MAG: hypothetical protein A2W22_05625 [Candidatus Levybacteria bacterium RBG_16_35_11]|nr:MAG: hypothetical protein A2W22_05625 [Candidatus Levybacteria bacterium RBG_16_35_11]